MTDRKIPVYAIDRKTILTYVSERVTSIGAARQAQVKAAQFAFVNNTPAWVEWKGRS